MRCRGRRQSKRNETSRTALTLSSWKRWSSGSPFTRPVSPSWLLKIFRMRLVTSGFCARPTTGWTNGWRSRGIAFRQPSTSQRLIRVFTDCVHLEDWTPRTALPRLCQSRVVWRRRPTSSATAYARWNLLHWAKTSFCPFGACPNVSSSFSTLPRLSFRPLMTCAPTCLVVSSSARTNMQWW